VHEREALAYGVRVCDEVEGSWSDVVAFASSLPRVFVHGDFSPLNLRVRPLDRGEVVVPLDWEKAGWGTPAVDLAWVDMDAYRAVARDIVPSMALLDPQRIRACADLFRVLSHDWTRKKATKVRQYAQRLRTASTAISLGEG
jgi:aminoglycoside phosphotransferase (APT) family kinase protein